MAQGAAGAFLAGTRPLGSWQEGGLGSAGRRRPARRGALRTPGEGKGRGLEGPSPAPHGATPTCCWAWILMYSALCLPCLPLSGLPAWPWTAFSREAPGVTTFMGGTLPPPLCRKRNRVGIGGGIPQASQALGGVSGRGTASGGSVRPGDLCTSLPPHP